MIKNIISLRSYLEASTELLETAPENERDFIETAHQLLDVFNRALENKSRTMAGELESAKNKLLWLTSNDMIRIQHDYPTVWKALTELRPAMTDASLNAAIHDDRVLRLV